MRILSINLNTSFLAGSWNENDDSSVTSGDDTLCRLFLCFYKVLTKRIKKFLIVLRKLFFTATLKPVLYSQRELAEI